MPLPRFESRSAYDAWMQQQPGRGWERHGSQVVSIAPDQGMHEPIKACVRRTLQAALRRANAPFAVLESGVRVGVEADTDYEPDAVVAFAGLAATEPMIIVEVSSPSISPRDLNIRLADYFLLPSIRHCVVVMSDERRVLHHRLGTSGELLTSDHHDGAIVLDPPGVTVALVDLYPNGFLKPV